MGRIMQNLTVGKARGKDEARAEDECDDHLDQAVRFGKR